MGYNIIPHILIIFLYKYISTGFLPILPLFNQNKKSKQSRQFCIQSEKCVTLKYSLLHNTSPLLRKTGLDIPILKSTKI